MPAVTWKFDYLRNLGLIQKFSLIQKEYLFDTVTREQYGTKGPMYCFTTMVSEPNAKPKASMYSKQPSENKVAIILLKRKQCNGNKSLTRNTAEWLTWSSQLFHSRLHHSVSRGWVRCIIDVPRTMDHPAISSEILVHCKLVPIRRLGDFIAHDAVTYKHQDECANAWLTNQQRADHVRPEYANAVCRRP